MTRYAWILVLGCCALAVLGAPQVAAAAPAGAAAPALAVDPLYQASPVSSAVRSIVLCQCPSVDCKQHGPGGEVCGGDPEVFCPPCYCVVGPNGTHYCAQSH